MKRIRQKLDTRITVDVSRAFAQVHFVFRSDEGEDVMVSLDMESALHITHHMDDGDKMKKALPWWRRWVT